MQYCCHVWAGAHSCCLETLDRVQKRRCRTVGSSLVSSLETLTHRRNEASLILFYRYYCRRCLYELGQLVPFPYFWGGKSTIYSDRLFDFTVAILRCYKDVYINSFFHSTGRLYNSLPIECFSLTFDLDDFMSRISRYIFACRFFLNGVTVCFDRFILSFHQIHASW